MIKKWKIIDYPLMILYLAEGVLFFAVFAMLGKIHDLYR